MGSRGRGRIGPCSPGAHSLYCSPSCDCFIYLDLRHSQWWWWWWWCCYLWNHSHRFLSIYSVVFGPLCKLFPILIIVLQGRYCYFILQVRKGMFQKVRWFGQGSTCSEWQGLDSKPSFVPAAPDSQDRGLIRIEDCIICWWALGKVGRM